MTTTKKKYITVLLNCLLYAFLVACSTQSSHLAHVESLLETNPLLADSLLSAMPQPNSNRSRAWYAVLKTQAQYKQYKPITSDSLIITATNFYGTRHKSYRSAMAWYTQGCVYMEMNDDVLAIDAYLKAKDLFPDTLLRYYALTEQNLGNCYLRKGMLNESHKIFSHCKKIAETIGDSTITAYSDYNLALINIQKYNYEGTDDSFKKLLSNDHLANYYKNECLIQLAKYHIYHTNKPDSAIYYLDLRLSINDKATKGATYNLLGNVYYRLGEYDSAVQYFNKALKERNDVYTLCDSYGRLSELSQLSGRKQEAFNYSKLYSESLDSIRVLTNVNDIAAITIAHKSEIETIKRKEFRSKTIITGLLILLIIVVMLYASYQSHVNKVKSNYIKLCDNIWASLNTNLSTDSTDIDYLSICKSRYMSSPSHPLLFHANEIKLGRSEKDAIKHDLNVAFSDLTAFLANKYPTINNREVQLCILSYLGMEKKIICHLLDLSDDSYRKQKSRLKEKLGLSYKLYFADKTPSQSV
jgi:tetratricopeptide (TPR) repeat protein